MKILRIAIPHGFKMLEPNFTINFLTKTRVDNDSVNEDLLELEPGFFYPLETAFIGKNSSGKTTTLELIGMVLELLNSGRMDKSHLDWKTPFSVEVLFYVKGTIYRYEGIFRSDERQYLLIEAETLEKTTMKVSYRKDLSNARYVKVPGFTPHTNGDTSAVCDYANDGSFNVPLDIAEGSVTDFRLFWKWLGENIFLSIVRLFDDSVESLSPVDKQGNAMNSFWFQRIGEEAPTMVDALTLEKLLSKGTVRGITLYALSIITFRVGGHLLVDEIESSFNRNLIENLMLMYDDKSINKQGGSIIYSTHYAELLDIHSRCDNVNVLHREGAKITLKNMSADYGVRTEMLKSAQFNQNTFDTLINYNRLMDLKEAVRKG